MALVDALSSQSLAALAGATAATTASAFQTLTTTAETAVRPATLLLLVLRQGFGRLTAHTDTFALTERAATETAAACWRCEAHFHRQLLLLLLLRMLVIIFLLRVHL